MTDKSLKKNNRLITIEEPRGQYYRISDCTCNHTVKSQPKQFWMIGDSNGVGTFSSITVYLNEMRYLLTRSVRLHV